MSAASSWSSSASLAAALMVVASACRTPPPPVPAPLPESIAEHIPAYRAFDRRPYEFIWTQRQTDFDQVVDFERLLGWTVHSAEGLNVELERTQDKQLFDEYVGRITLPAHAESTTLRLIPPEPLRIRDPVNSASMWIQSDTEVRAFFEIEDARNGQYDHALGTAPAGFWNQLHRTLPQEFNDPEAYPLALMGIRLEMDATDRPQEVYLDAAALYAETLLPLDVPKRPRRPLPLRLGQQQGMNTGEGTLSFPTRAETLAPSSQSRPEPIRVKQIDPQLYALSGQEDSAQTFHIRLEPKLQIVDVRRAGLSSGIAFELIHDPPAMPPLVARVEEQGWHVEYADGTTYRLAILGDSLLLDVSRRGGQTTKVALQKAPATVMEEAWSFPFLSSAATANPPVWMRRLPERTLFSHAVIDPYRSNASSLSWDAERQQLAAHYSPPRGRRLLDIHERFVLSISDQLDGVLPRVPNPQAARAVDLVERIWSDTPSAEQQDLMVVSGPDIWTDGDGSFSFRYRANPHRGGNAALRQQIAALQDMGHSFALYTHVGMISPLNDYWSVDRIARASHGDRRHVPGGFVPKAFVPWQWMQEWGPELREQFRPDMLYLAGLTDRAPWFFTDFDFRSPGAATFSQILYALGEGLERTGTMLELPLLADGDGALFYAGLADGFLVQEPLWQQRPWRPDFKLRRMNTRAVFFGAGPTDLIQSDRDLDAYLATQIAYGNAGRWSPFDERSYWMMKAIQPRYLLQAPINIRYWNGDLLIETEEALSSGAWRRSQLYFQYRDDTEIWVNGSETDTWQIQAGAESWTLPPFGWLARGPNYLIFSGLIDEHRIDYAETPDFTYFHPRGRLMTFRGLETDQPLILR